MSMNHRCFFILDRIVWPLTTFTDRPENSFRSSAFQRLFFRSSGFKICQPMRRPCTASCLTAWAFLLKMNGLTKRPSVHHLYDWGCQEDFALRRQQSDPTAPGTWKIWFDWTKTSRARKAMFGVQSYRMKQFQQSGHDCYLVMQLHQDADPALRFAATVSYTHLTLPTILLV